ncbi:IMP dehydrogenase [Aliidiomarina taiwanensis]|uniref:IMP dehydrogenase n=1 Tax=Aliidiomarina taiwanensis TaxID=946228 RepID=A0A432X8W9_9GAMM|nr:VWA domain-containing protein [Aliidiomarina taiwanensis]RUO43842.1 IMP dehydrogenase [Aliidiomarina taiwanensis]
MFSFAWSWVLLLLPLPLVLLFAKSSGVDTAKLHFPGSASRGLTGTQAPSLSNLQRLRQLFLPFIVWCCVVVAAAQPRWLGEPIPTQQQAREILIAMDLSGSMRQEDMRMNGQPVSRLYAAHHILADFIRRRQGDRIGLIIYADSAHMYVPLTSDLDTVARLAEEAELGLVGSQTALGDAIGLAIKSFITSNSEQRVILMLTDGMINAGRIGPEEAILLAKNNDVRIHTIGIGADEMVVPSLFGERRINPSQELNEPFLTEVAHASGGEYFRARNVREMERIYSLIDQLEPVQSEQQQFRPQRSLVHWPLGLGLLCVLLHAGLFWLKQRSLQGRAL